MLPHINGNVAINRNYGVDKGLVDRVIGACVSMVGWTKAWYPLLSRNQLRIGDVRFRARFMFFTLSPDVTSPLDVLSQPDDQKSHGAANDLGRLV